MNKRILLSCLVSLNGVAVAASAQELLDFDVGLDEQREAGDEGTEASNKEFVFAPVDLHCVCWCLASNEEGEDVWLRLNTTAPADYDYEFLDIRDHEKCDNLERGRGGQGTSCNGWDGSRRPLRRRRGLLHECKLTAVAANNGAAGNQARPGVAIPPVDNQQRPVAPQQALPPQQQQQQRQAGDGPQMGANNNEEGNGAIVPNAGERRDEAGEIDPPPGNQDQE